MILFFFLSSLFFFFVEGGGRGKHVSVSGWVRGCVHPDRGKYVYIHTYIHTYT